MKINKFDTDQSVYIIAEIGNNHEGDINLAKEMIGLVAETGANAVKFQTFIPEFYVSSSDKERLKRLESFRLSFEQFKELSLVAKEKGLDFISTPFDIKSAKFLNSIQDVFKISSSDNTFYPLIKTIAGFGKPIIMSTGLSTIGEIKKTTELIMDVLETNHLKSELGILHCVTSYPVPLEFANISMIQRLKNEFQNLTIGYSDHTLGNAATVLSVSAGARIIEKHFTIDKNYSSFRDHQISADPDDMKELVDRIREAEIIMGDPSIEIQKVESDFLIPVRRSIAASKNLKYGSKIKENDITWVRPGTGFKPGEESYVIGKTCTRNIVMGEIIQGGDIK